MSKEILAIITARGGSKRIPKKNIKDFCGKPILAYSIEASLKSNVFSEVMVTTDSVEIAEISKKYGASVPFYRSQKTSDDFATSADVLTEVIEKYKELGKEFEYICCIYPTAPFISAEKLKAAYDILMENPEINEVFPIVSFSFPPQRALRLNNGAAEIINPDTYQMRSQDFETLYHECGQFYFMKTDVFLETQKLVLPNSKPIIVDETEVQDIDNITDWKLAELKYRMMMEKESNK